MNMKWILVLALLLTPVAAKAEVIDQITVGNWKLRAQTNDRGRFSHCSMKAQYDNGIALNFRLTKDMKWTMSFDNERWSLRNGGTVPIQYRVDHGPWIRTKAQAVGRDQLGVNLIESNKLFALFKRGDTLIVEAGDQTLRFSLAGTSIGLDTLMNCVQRHSRGRR
ncbi:MAG: hypothetical protein HQL38_16095 [Alphaproteobacteria bacterium]|nr:hypothetical protein [Alphaproteobacteria bacterium]MBF0374330.1 hypothetical protein [Alphaproteobacteria bacterium]MBF0394198.1 hypothetical protein [Alphaproteobacteria bacterium]